MLILISIRRPTLFAPVAGPLLQASGAPFSLHSQRGPAPLTLLTDC